jgi:hypothetical protein
MIKCLEMEKTLRSKLVLLCLLVTSCLSTNSAPSVPVETRPDELCLDKSFFTFVILDNSADGASLGCGFIADHALYTAKHLLKNQYANVSVLNGFVHDVAIMGTTLVKGLEICTERHSDGDWLYYTARGKNIDITICKVRMNKYIVEASSNIKPGDSGSPVLCLDHNRVAGLVSAYVPENLRSLRDGGTKGVIAIIKPNNFEPTGHPKR